jgi:hypothetical protein
MEVELVALEAVEVPLALVAVAVYVNDPGADSFTVIGELDPVPVAVLEEVTV